MQATEWVGDTASAHKRDLDEARAKLREAREEAAREKHWRLLTQQRLAEAEAQLAAERECLGDPETAQFRAGLLAAAKKLDDMRARCFDYEDRERYEVEARVVRGIVPVGVA